MGNFDWLINDLNESEIRNRIDSDIKNSILDSLGINNEDTKACNVIP